MATLREDASAARARIERLTRGLTLADKCALLFGAAIIVILAVALLVPWIRLGAVVDQSQVYTSRQLAQLWETGRATESTGTASAGAPIQPDDVDNDAPAAPAPDARIVQIPSDRLDEETAHSDFLAAAVRRFRAAGDSPPSEYAESLWDGSVRVYRYARAERDKETRELTGVTLVERRSAQTSGVLLVNRIYVVVAGLGAVALATLVFYQITRRIILSPVRKLRRTAEAVREGDLTIRSEIATGDEFEELADTFNSMLTSISTSQEQLRSVNRSMDLRIGQLAQSNSALEDANRLKGEFLANVSHELRTPLNSIIGFAELLQSAADPQPDPLSLTSEQTAQIIRRRRYLDNIVTAGRTLLEMINELLEMAKIEAGKVDLRVEPMNVAETCDGLLALIRPQAEKKQISLSLELPPSRPPAPATPAGDGEPDAADPASLPVIHTDHRKLQQIVFNFLSNAVKFTPEGGRVALRGERLPRGTADGRERVRISVLDTGPGIREEDQGIIFEKFRQLDAGHTKGASGTGLGLAIAKELAAVLQGEIQLVSAPGSGSMFSLIVPVDLDEDAARDAASRLAGRAFAGRATDRPADQPSTTPG